MNVILLERIPRLGRMGETVRVRDGFARNYLLPTGRALRANAANQARFEAERSMLEQRNEERRTDAQSIADTLDGKSFVAVRAAGETGQLYGSVSTRDIADLLAENGFKIGRNDIRMDQPIKRIGLHKLEIALHAEVDATVTINVARSSDEAQRQARGEDLSDPDTLFGPDEDEDDGVLDENDSEALAAEQVDAPAEDPAERDQPTI